MKTIAIWNRYGELFRDGRCFDTTEAPIGDGLLKPYRMLRERGAKEWFCRVDTLDRLWAQAVTGGVNGVIFFDYPAPHEEKVIDVLRVAGIPLYLVTWENELIVPKNFDPAIHTKFKKVFTWHSLWERNALPGGRRYVPIRVPQDFGWQPEGPEAVDLGRSFACMVSSQKNPPRRADGEFDERELYTARVDTLQWFAIRASEELHLYGPGWNGAEQWRGTIPPGRKRSIMSCYDFAFTYENAQGIPGYITEKVFDAMMAGCIPIYWGAPDVRDYLPTGTFIDRRSFVNHEGLFSWLSMLRADESSMKKYRQNIREFLDNAELIKPWTIETFVDTILREVT